MLRNNLIYTFLLGSLFLILGLSLDGTDKIRIEAEDPTHWGSEKNQHYPQDLPSAIIEEFDEIRQINKKLLSEHTENQKELMYMLFNLKENRTPILSEK